MTEAPANKWALHTTDGQVFEIAWNPETDELRVRDRNPWDRVTVKRIPSESGSKSRRVVLGVLR